MKKFIVIILLCLVSAATFAQSEKDSIQQQRQELKSLGLSDKAIEKLSAEQIVKIFALQQRQHYFNPGGEQRKQIIVPFIVFFSGVIVAGLALFFNYKKSESLNRLLYKSIEAGVPIPADFFNKKSSGKGQDFKRGVILTAAGLGITTVLFIEGLVWSIGLVPLFIGIGFLIVSVLDKNVKSEGTIRNG